MKQPQATFTWDQMDAILRASGMADDPIPDGAVSTDDWAKHYHVAPRNALVKLDRLVAEGRMQCGWGRSPSGRRAKFYWPKETTDAPIG